MEIDAKTELHSFLKALPSVDFCCIYGSALHPSNDDKTKLVDFILGVSDPVEWHCENLKLNGDHYASWMAHLGGAKLITGIADRIGVGVHFNPYVKWNDRMFKYGVTRMHDLVEDVTSWERFYLSGRLQKPVHMLVDNCDLEHLNSVNLRAAISAALLLLPMKFSEVDLYAKICSLSYNGDVRMFFAEDKGKVKKIVDAQFGLFQSMYRPFLHEYEAKDLLRSSPSSNQANISQDCSLSASHIHLHFLAPAIRNQMAIKLGETRHVDVSGQHELLISSREEAAKFMQKILRRKVMASSARQAISGLLAAGGVNGMRYLARKMRKAWNSNARV